jgi:hypothetical protein
MPNEIAGVKNSTARIMKWAKKNPVVVVMLVGGIILLAYFTMRKSSGESSSDSGLALSSSGEPTSGMASGDVVGGTSTDDLLNALASQLAGIQSAPSYSEMLPGAENGGSAGGWSEAYEYSTIEDDSGESEGWIPPSEREGAEKYKLRDPAMGILKKSGLSPDPFTKGIETTKLPDSTFSINKSILEKSASIRSPASGNILEDFVNGIKRIIENANRMQEKTTTREAEEITTGGGKKKKLMPLTKTTKGAGLNSLINKLGGDGPGYGYSAPKYNSGFSSFGSSAPKFNPPSASNALPRPPSASSSGSSQKPMPGASSANSIKR